MPNFTRYEHVHCSSLFLRTCCASRQGETRPREGGHTIQQGETRRETRGETRPQEGGHTIQKGNKKGDKGRQGDKTLGKRTHHPTKGNKKGDKGRQDLGKADTPSNKGKQEGRQGETRPRESGHTIEQRETRRETMGDKGKVDRPSNTKADTLRKH